MPGLSGCGTKPTSVAFANDGSGYVYVPFKKESKAFLINNDQDAWIKANGNNEQCQKDTGCLKEQ